MTARHEIVTIEHGPYRLELCPKGGGCMTAFRYDDTDLFRPATEEYWQAYEPRASGSFPLVPFSNRIADGLGIEVEDWYPPEPPMGHWTKEPS